MPTPVILDVDPGHDDAMAILLARADPRVDLLALTVVAGNQTLDKCALNARRVCTIAGIDDVPIAAGADGPLARSLRIADDVHGASGLDGPQFGKPEVDLDDRHAVELIYDTLRAHPEPVTLIPTGPLTNIALLLREHPDVRGRIHEIVLMGGSTGRGNVTPYAEANIYVDPEAAAEVFESGLDITMVGLNVTHQALVTGDVVARLREIGTPLADTCVQMMTFFGSTYRELWGMPAPPLHDPVAVARVIDPSLVRCVDAPVRIETRGEYTAGATVTDLHHLSGRPDNARVAVELDQPRFWDLMIDAVADYPANLA
ncbi:nucleoside hydrolase [Phytoactinopolyspora mesophila]|uniref:Pyrimidine-specific ribonucleoside hydrolase RihA n=1 Tax=Phytoactinopolyspora mesophila TaxID=2650750 RepID=A0A7K3M708_9ACTN|nr:nucleoside hydrolase [Phytoactinopolyspora mesophila]NDL59101.1 pyrimidine-specific ribonucleoside hydrolase RihA [Phytoactinopolyspora mesophila]